MSYPCGCSTHDEGTNFCAEHKDAFIWMMAAKGKISPWEAAFRLKNEGLPSSENLSFPVLPDESVYPKWSAHQLDRETEDSDGQPSEQKEWEDFETDGGGYSPALNEEASDGLSDRELDAQYEREKEERWSGPD